MPPRSLCLNVFTTSLGASGSKDVVDVAMKEVEANDAEKIPERTRHDSVQESPNDTFYTPPVYPHPSHELVDTASTVFDKDVLASIPIVSNPFSQAGNFSMGNASPFAHVNAQSFLPSTCDMCNQHPTPGNTLQRCSRCKCTYYCSKACQKSAWRTHKVICGPTLSRSPSLAQLTTPNDSAPASPRDIIMT